MPADSFAVHTFSPRSARRHLQPGVPQHKGTTQAQVRRASAPARPLSRVLTLPHPRAQAAVSAGAAQTAAGFLRPLQREAVALSTAPEIEALSHHTGVAISKFFAADTEGRRLWISGVLRGIFAQQGPGDLCAALGAQVPQLSEAGAGQVALIAVSQIDAPELLVNLLVEALHRRPSVIERVELLVEAARSVRQYGRAEVTLSKKRSGALSRLLLDLVALLWRRINSGTAQKAPAIVAADLSGGGFTASNYDGAIARASHTSVDIAVSLCEMLLARNDGLLVLLDVCQLYDKGAVFKIHFQRHVRDPFEIAMRNFCGMLFTVQRVPRNTWATLLALQGECEAAFALLGGVKLLLSYKESITSFMAQSENCCSATPPSCRRASWRSAGSPCE